MAGDRRAHRVAFQVVQLQKKWQLLNVLQPGFESAPSHATERRAYGRPCL